MESRSGKNYARQNNAVERGSAKKPRPDEEERSKINLIRGGGMANERRKTEGR